MKTGPVVLLGGFAPAYAAEAPIQKVISMIGELQAKIIGEGEAAHHEYAAFAEWCEDRSTDLGQEIKTGNSEVKSLKATIALETSFVQRLTAKVEELASDLKVDESDLKAAIDIREREAAAFASTKRDLVETTDMLGRAILILEREMQGGASMVQLKNARNLGQAFSVLVEASLIGAADVKKLTALLQGSEGGEDVGAPAGAVYESHSGDIVGTLQDLREKAQQQLDAARGKETEDVQSFELLRQSIKDEIKNGNKEMAEAKKNIAQSSEKKSTAQGDLEATSKELAADVESKSKLHHDCMTRAENYEAETNSRAEELKALAEAKKIIAEATGASLSQVSFLQAARSTVVSKARLSGLEAVRIVRELASKQHSVALAQLAGRMASAMRSEGGEDQFKKVKGLIADMISKLEKEAEADATKKAYCDTELGETNARKAEKMDEIDRLDNKIDQMSAKSSQLKEEIATLQNELAKLAKSQSNSDQLRQNEKAMYEEEKAELVKGVDGLRLALKVLTEYYAKEDKDHGAADGAGNSIISLLEVCESDFSKNLAQINSDEDSAVAEYEQVTKENEIEKATKDQSVKYKTKESKRLDEEAAELSGDRGTAQEELDAALKYLKQLDAKCIDKAETYAQSQARRSSELAGLREALRVLETETALLQEGTARRALRGSS